MFDVERTTECPIEDLAAYIDGELDPHHELKLEAHLANCSSCSVELNRQKQFLCGLNSSLNRDRELELPADFTRLVVANAESAVSGLRKPRERFNALFVCMAMFLFVMFTLRPEATRLFDGVSAVLEQAATVGAFFGHL
ncbi:MAG: zf-HC2 domain-containing protein, partial [Pyrinomonadaceae bacterium]